MWKNKNKRGLGRLINDIIIYLVIFITFSFLIYSVIKSSDENEWKKAILQIVGDSCIFLLGLVGIFEFCYDNNLSFFIPSSYSKQKDKDARKKASEAFSIFYDKETEFIEKTSDERIKQILLHYNSSDSEALLTPKASYIKARINLKNDEKDGFDNLNIMRDKFEEILFTSNVIFDLSNGTLNPSTDIQYYIRTHDLLYHKDDRRQVAQIMTSFIGYNINKDSYDIIMVPHSSNLYLGDEVSHQIQKPMIKMIHPDTAIELPFKYENENIIPKKIKEKDIIRTIVIHDVLFSGNQIVDSINSLIDSDPRFKVVGVFCLVCRKAKSLKNNVRRIELKSNCKVYSLLTLSEDEIRSELSRHE